MNPRDFELLDRLVSTVERSTKNTEVKASVAANLFLRLMWDELAAGVAGVGPVKSWKDAEEKVLLSLRIGFRKTLDAADERGCPNKGCEGCQLRNKLRQELEELMATRH